MVKVTREELYRGVMIVLSFPFVGVSWGNVYACWVWVGV